MTALNIVQSFWQSFGIAMAAMVALSMFVLWVTDYFDL